MDFADNDDDGKDLNEILSQHNNTVELSTNTTNVETETTDLTPIYIGVPAIIILLGVLIGFFCKYRSDKSKQEGEQDGVEMIGRASTMHP